MSNPKEFLKWQQQIVGLADYIEEDIIQNRRIFQAYKDIVRANPAIGFEHGADFHIWAERNHLYALLAALRKIFFLTNKKEYSLLKIIGEMIESGSVVTQANYPDLVGIKTKGSIGGAVVSSASEGFFNANGTLDLVKLQKDKQYLTETLKYIPSFINERVLHVQKNPKAVSPSDEELNEAIVKLLDLLKEYRLFLTGHSVGWSLDATDASWRVIFTKPWIVS